MNWNFLRFLTPQKERHIQADRVNHLLKRLARDSQGMVLNNPSTLMHSRVQRDIIRSSLVELITNAKKTLDEINRIPLR